MLTVAARPSPHGVEVLVQDTGGGIPPEILNADLRAVLHDESKRQRPRADDLPLAALDDAGRAQARERARHRHHGAAPAPVSIDRAVDARLACVNRPRILVVDDDAGMLRAAERVLGSQYDVSCCQSARDALARVSTFEPDVALLDVRMPEMSGFELREALRDLCPGLDVIFMTGSLNQLDATFIRAIRRTPSTSSRSRSTVTCC